MTTERPSAHNLAKQTEPPPITAGAPASSELPNWMAEVRSLLGELRDLLDASGPTWYEERHHARISAAMALLERAQGESDPSGLRQL